MGGKRRHDETQPAFQRGRDRVPVIRLNGRPVTVWQAATAAERERAAKVCDEIAETDGTGYGIAEDRAAAAIRQRLMIQCQIRPINVDNVCVPADIHFAICTGQATP